MIEPKEAPDWFRLQRTGVSPPPRAEAPPTYSSISTIQRADEAAERSLKPGLEVEQVYTAGAVPKLPGGPWAAGDHFGTERPLGQNINSDDPSGINKHRGPG